MKHSGSVGGSAGRRGNNGGQEMKYCDASVWYLTFLYLGWPVIKRQ